MTAVAGFCRPQSAVVACSLSRGDPAVMAGVTRTGFCHAVIVARTRKCDAAGVTKLAGLGREYMMERHRRGDHALTFGMAASTISWRTFEDAAGMACGTFHDDMGPAEREACRCMIKFATGALGVDLDIRWRYAIRESLQHLFEVRGRFSCLWFPGGRNIFCMC